MSAENIGFGFSRWQQANGTAAGATTKQISTNRSVLGKVIVNSHTTGTFRFANGTATSYTPISGTYTPATGSSVIELGFIDAFPNGLLMLMAGTLDTTVLYNDL